MLSPYEQTTWMSVSMGDSFLVRLDASKLIAFLKPVSFCRALKRTQKCAFNPGT